MARTNAVMTREIFGTGRTARIVWRAVTGGRSLEFDMAKVSDETYEFAAVFGVGSKIGDGAAKTEATVDEKFSAMEKIRDNLYAGKWRGDRETLDQSLIEAILEFDSKLSREKVSDDVRGMAAAERKVLRAHPPIKKILDRIEAAAVKKSGVDPAAILAKFIHG